MMAVIGAGPVGLFSLFALGQVGLTAAIAADAFPEPGGQCAALYPEKPIYDIPSRTSVTGASLIEDLEIRRSLMHRSIISGRKAVSVSSNGDEHTVTLSDGSRLNSRAIIIAAGGGAFGPNRPPLKDIERYEGSSVFYSVTSIERFRGRHVVIAGGGDSAADWAAVLAEIAESTTVVHRRTSFRAAPATLNVLEQHVAAGRMRIAAPRTLHSLVGSDGTLESINLKDDGGNLETLRADALLCFFGLAKDLRTLASWDLGLSDNAIPVDPKNMMTRRTGVYAIGDVSHYPGKLKLILNGFAEGRHGRA